jgi:hypothetical protein
MQRAIAIAVLLSFTPALGSGWTLYSIRTDGALLVLQPADGTVLSSQPITLAGETVLNGNGLAYEPSSGTMWGLLTLSGQVGRELVTIDPEGVATSIGNTGRNFAGLAFDDAGTLYGLTGTGTIPPATLYTLDMTTAASESVLALTNLGGHAIAFHPDDGLLYHATGGALEKVDVDLSTITPVPTSGHPWFSAQGMTYYEGSAGLLLVANFGLYLSLTITGVADSLGTTAASKGLATVPSPGAAPLQDVRALELRAWPNPYRGGTLRASLTRAGAEVADLEVFDVSGRLVRVLGRDGGWTWDGQDAQGRAVPSGSYFLRLRAKDAVESARIVILR